MSDAPESKESRESKVEAAKRQGRYLRGTIAESLASDAESFSETDAQLLKFHGAYQQDDRDLRKKVRAAGGHKAYRFMVRVAIPAGRLTAEQYLVCDELADRCGNGTLRITTRQDFQFHGVLKRNLKETIAGVNRVLLTTLGGCGDVERNVMACPAPLADRPHVFVRDLARRVAAELRPATRAYHEIWLDGEKISPAGEEEPFYGPQYLPRKFKTGVALDTDNCVDVYADDCGLLASVEDGEVVGLNVLAGGGLGMTHRQKDTMARLADPVGFIAPEHGVEAVKTVAAIFRDHGNREDRRHARIKYLIAAWGIDRFREEFRRRFPFELAPPRPLPKAVHHDHLGRHPQGDGRWFYGIFVENGRIADGPARRVRSALREIVRAHRPAVVLTPSQNILMADLPSEDAISQVEATLREHGVPTAEEVSAARRYALACPALPTCGLALGEAERVMPQVVGEFEAELEALGLRDAPITIRMTGCPNGCARPYTADVAFVGRGPGVYNIYVGGGPGGDRVADLFATDVPIGEVFSRVRPLLGSWAASRREGESLGDFYQRILARAEPRRSVTGLEEPTAEKLELPGDGPSSRGG